MKGTKLISLLKTFTPDEIRSFEKFIVSPYFNSVKNYMKLLKELEKFYPEFDDEKLTNEYIFKKLYKGKSFNRQIFWNMASGFEKLAEKFLEQVALQKNSFERLEFLIWEYRDRKLLNHYSHIMNQIEKLLEAKAIEYDYFEKKGHLETYKQLYYHLIDKIKPMSDSKLKASEYQILLFLRMTVGGLNDMAILSKNYNAKFEVNIPQEFAKHIDLKKIVQYAYNKNHEYAFLIDIYYHSLMLFLEPNEEEHLIKARKLYETHFNKFTMSEKRTIMHWIYNYCRFRTDTEGIKYEKIMFELNEFRLKEGLAFFPEGQMPKANFNQILKTALSINEIKWAEDFIKKYMTTLQAEIRQSIKAMAMAFLHIQTKKFEKVLKNLATIEFVDFVDKLSARSMQAISYYELKEFETLLNHIDSSKHFLKKNKSVGELYRESYWNFYNYLHKLVLTLEKNEDLSLIPVLRKEILSTVKLENKKWLIEKIDEL